MVGVIGHIRKNVSLFFGARRMAPKPTPHSQTASCLSLPRRAENSRAWEPSWGVSRPASGADYGPGRPVRSTDPTAYPCSSGRKQIPPGFDTGLPARLATQRVARAPAAAAISSELGIGTHSGATPTPAREVAKALAARPTGDGQQAPGRCCSRDRAGASSRAPIPSRLDDRALVSSSARDRVCNRERCGVTNGERSSV
jgi:hypothetical protein